jgi:hypothetical protein
MHTSYYSLYDYNHIDNYMIPIIITQFIAINSKNLHVA